MYVSRIQHQHQLLLFFMQHMLIYIGYVFISYRDLSGILYQLYKLTCIMTRHFIVLRYVHIFKRLHMPFIEVFDVITSIESVTVTLSVIVSLLMLKLVKTNITLE